MSLLSLWFLNRITVFYSKWSVFHFFGSSLCLTSPMKNLSDSYLIKIWILFDLNSFQFRSNFDYFQISFIICLNLDLYMTEIVYFWLKPDSNLTHLLIFTFFLIVVLVYCHWRTFVAKIFWHTQSMFSSSNEKN